MTATLQHQDQESGNPGEHRALKQRDAEDQFKTNRGPDEFGEVGCHGDNFRLNPVKPYRRTRIVIANLFSQVFARGNPQLRGQHLDQHGHQVSPHDHPEQLIAEAGPGLNIGRKVTWIDIADGSNERRSH